eukprot:scaffold61760_cov21-Tisochrysis_lutea.AAC.1
MMIILFSCSGHNVFATRSSIEHRAQPPSCYRTLVKREEGDSKEEVPGSNPCGRGGDKDALYRWEPVGGSFLNARGRTASVDLSFFATLLPAEKKKKKKKKKGNQCPLAQLHPKLLEVGHRAPLSPDELQPHHLILIHVLMSFILMPLEHCSS